jgi:hypothetical protein
MTMTGAPPDSAELPLPPLSHTAMTDNNYRTVRFLIQGKSDTDKVKNVPLENDVGDLRKAIWEASFRMTEDVLAADLILWKVRHIESLANRCSLGDIPTGRSQPGSRR